MSVRICVIADIHHGALSCTKRGDAALQLIDEFKRYVDDVKPDFVLDLGDRISDIDRDTDLRLEQEVKDAFHGLSVPLHHICGNHDREHLDVCDNEAILNQSLDHQTLDVGGWRIALWRADSKIVRGADYSGFVLRENDLLWLSRTTQNADRPLLVVSHVPVSGHSQIGNYYFENNASSSTYPMAERAREALAQASVPVVFLSGHVHWNTITKIDGITHLTQQSLTESFTTQGEPAGAYGLIELDERVHWQVLGKDPIDYSFTPKVERWTTRMPVFREHPEARSVAREQRK
nr:metallophosphoesterase [uncultured Cohaesibacter sp.]